MTLEMHSECIRLRRSILHSTYGKMPAHHFLIGRNQPIQHPWHCGVMVSGICEWCHRRRLMSWVAFHRKHTETPWGRRIPKDEFWEIENPTCRNIPKQPEEKSLFNRSSRYVKTASRFHITGKSEGLRWCQLHSNLWHPLLHLNLKPKKHTWQNAYLAWKEPNDDDRWGERSPGTRDCFEAIYRNMIDSSKPNRLL